MRSWPKESAGSGCDPSGRASGRTCGANDQPAPMLQMRPDVQHPFKRPKVSGRCDDDNAPLIARKDDQEDVIRQRLRTYEEVTRPILSHYPSNRYFQISGDRSATYIFEEVTHVLESLLERPSCLNHEDLRSLNLRSWKWFGPDTLRGFGHRSRLKQTRLRRRLSPVAP